MRFGTRTRGAFTFEKRTREKTTKGAHKKETAQRGVLYWLFFKGMKGVCCLNQLELIPRRQWAVSCWSSRASSSPTPGYSQITFKVFGGDNYSTFRITHRLVLEIICDVLLIVWVCVVKSSLKVEHPKQGCGIKGFIPTSVIQENLALCLGGGYSLGTPFGLYHSCHFPQPPEGTSRKPRNGHLEARRQLPRTHLSQKEYAPFAPFEHVGVSTHPSDNKRGLGPPVVPFKPFLGRVLLLK